MSLLSLYLCPCALALSVATLKLHFSGRSLRSQTLRSDPCTDVHILLDLSKRLYASESIGELLKFQTPIKVLSQGLSGNVDIDAFQYLHLLQVGILWYSLFLWQSYSAAIAIPGLL